MSSAWDVEMRALLCVLFLTAFVLADKNDNRRNKLPFVADAVGNSLPPPSSVPATVGSPVNLLTPDRYEFYTFDESGELVKKLMTLEEIQAIVAAGEEGEGLVTFANDNQPTIAFNFSQPPYTKVHSVVTNVQNVLKAQMEAHKNKPHVQPTLDTPDVSDTWSLILPSIFGNTGVDIVPDKSSGTFTTPETETYDVDHSSEVEENSLSKEIDNQAISSSTTIEEKMAVTDKLPSTAEVMKLSTTTSSTTTGTSTTSTTTTTPKPSTTTRQPTTTTRKPTTTTRQPTTTTRQTTTTTSQPTTSTTTTKKPSTTNRPNTTTRQSPTRITNKPRSTTTTAKPSTTSKPIVRTTVKTTTIKPEIIKSQFVNTSTNKDTENNINIQIQPNSNSISSTEKNEIVFEKLSTFIPVSTINYVTQRTQTTTNKPITTKSPTIYSSTTKIYVTTTTKAPPTQRATSPPSMITDKPAFSTFSYISSTFKDPDLEKANATTMTTQSVSPSTTVSSTENFNLQNSIIENKRTSDVNDNDNEKGIEPMLPLFDVAQSISQIASDLGGNYQPLPTTSNLLDNTKVNVIDLESKENLDLDIPFAGGNETEMKILNSTGNNMDNFVKISTLDPHNKNVSKDTDVKEMIKTNKDKIDITVQTVQQIEITTVPTEETTIDLILSESMGDLLSQVVNETPQSIVDSEEKLDTDSKISTTEKTVETTRTEDLSQIEKVSESSIKVKKEATSSTTEAAVELVSVKEISQPSVADIIITANNITNNTESDEMKTEITPKPDENPITEKHVETKLPENIEQNENERGDVNFVEISMFTNKNESKEEIEPIKPEIRFGSIENNTVIKEENKENMPDVKNTEIKENDLNNTVVANIETTTPVLVTRAPSTTLKSIIENKFSPSKFNKINSGDKLSASSKKDRIPEPLPKVDDFKKKIQKVNIAEEELISERNNSWKLVPTLSPNVNEIPKDKPKAENHYTPENENKDIVLEYSQENQGLEVTTRDLGEDIAQFTELCNELAFRYWNVMVENIDKRRSFVLSPYSITSMLAMMFMGARGATSGEMNDILKLDDMVTFNPHFTLKNISDSIEMTTNSGIAVSAFIRELYSDRTKGKILTFYKERAQHFYNGHVEEINFKLISDIIRRRTNLLVKRYTWGKIAEYMKTNNIVMLPPLAAFSANIFQTDCTGTSVDGRDGEMYFVVSPNVRQRRLVPVPAVVYKSGFLAGYDPVLDATAAALGNTNSVVSTLFLMPGQQGNVVHADDLEKLEQRLVNANPTTPTWSRLLRTLLPRTGLELQIPRFSHKSIFNVSSTLQKMGLKDLFDADHADLGGLNGPSKDLFLSDMIQLSSFVTCGEGVVGEQHHIEEYPDSLSVAQRRRTSRWVNDWDEPRDYQRAFHDPHDVSDAMHLPLHLRPRQARLPSRSAQPARLKYDRPFLYFVRHNPSGMILYFGRYNPRLLP